MSTPHDGGPAYPHTIDYAAYVKEPGMTIRQRYKMAALTLFYNKSAYRPERVFADFAGRVADAMLAEDAAHAAKQREGKP